MNGNLSITLLIVVVALALLARCDVRHAMRQTGCIVPTQRAPDPTDPANLPGPGLAASVSTTGRTQEGGEHDPVPKEASHRRRP